VLILGSVAHEEQDARRREAVHEAVEQGLRFRVDPRAWNRSRHASNVVAGPPTMTDSLGLALVDRGTGEVLEAAVS
jgi:hypothetical protein